MANTVIRRNLSTPEARAFWASAEANREEVESWPAWRRAGMVAPGREPCQPRQRCPRTTLPRRPERLALMHYLCRLLRILLLIQVLKRSPRSCRGTTGSAEKSD